MTEHLSKFESDNSKGVGNNKNTKEEDKSVFNWMRKNCFNFFDTKKKAVAEAKVLVKVISKLSATCLDKTFKGNTSKKILSVLYPLLLRDNKIQTSDEARNKNKLTVLEHSYKQQERWASLGYKVVRPDDNKAIFHVHVKGFKGKLEEAFGNASGLNFIYFYNIDQKNLENFNNNYKQWINFLLEKTDESIRLLKENALRFLDQNISSNEDVKEFANLTLNKNIEIQKRLEVQKSMLQEYFPYIGAIRIDEWIQGWDKYKDLYASEHSVFSLLNTDINRNKLRNHFLKGGGDPLVLEILGCNAGLHPHLELALSVMHRDRDEESKKICLREELCFSVFTIK